MTIFTQRGGYARLNAALITSFVLVFAVLLYQYYAFRGPRAEEVNGIQVEYSFVQFFPQTVPASPQAAYELVVTDESGSRFSLGRFHIANQDTITDLNGKRIQDALFALPKKVTGMRQAELRVVDQQNNQRPFSIEFLKGDFQKERAFITFGIEESEAAGQYMLGTPTDGDETLNERSGLWFGDYRQSLPGLRLAALKPGWMYEGWAVVNGQPLTIGRFRSAAQRDGFSTFSASQGAVPNIPGEDFLKDPPVLVFPDLTFPVDLAGDAVRVSIEPDIEGFDPTGQAPFGFTILQAEIPRGADAHRLYDLNAKDLTQPKATVVLR